MAEASKPGMKVGKRQALNYAGRQLPVIATVDCCVLGGGTAGVAAAVNAGRRGVSTLVVERGIALGGMQTLGLVEPFMPTFAPDSDTPFVAEVKKRMQQEGIAMCDGTTSFGWTNPETLAYVYDELMAAAKVQILYQAVLVDVLVQPAAGAVASKTKNPEKNLEMAPGSAYVAACDNKTGAVSAGAGKKVQQGSTEDGWRLEGESAPVQLTAVILQTVEGLVAVAAKTFIDATGDAVLARLSGVPVEAGYPKTGYNQPLSFRFEMGGIDLERLYAYMQSIDDHWCKTRPPYFEIALARHRDIKYKLEPFFVQGIAAGELTQEDAEYFQAFTIVGKPGCMSMNCPELPVRFRAVDALSYSRGVSYGRAMIRRISRFLIRHLPGFEKAYVSREAAMLGARESFRIKGLYYGTEADYYARRRFTDAVVRTAWYIDAHGEKVGDYLAPGEYYEIPYRAMICSQVQNLVVAGRCISVSFILEASMRIQPTCMSIGEAAGIAAAWALKHGLQPNRVDWAQLPAAERSYVSS